LAQTATLVKASDESNFEDNVRLLKCVPLVDTEKDIADSVKLTPLPEYWEMRFVSSDGWYDGHVKSQVNTLRIALLDSGFDVCYKHIRKNNKRSYIVRHKSKRQMSLFLLKHSELVSNVEFYDFQFNKRGNGELHATNY